MLRGPPPPRFLYSPGSDGIPEGVPTPRCPECGFELEHDEDECPNCGAIIGDYEEEGGEKDFQ